MQQSKQEVIKVISRVKRLKIYQVYPFTFKDFPGVIILNTERICQMCTIRILGYINSNWFEIQVITALDKPSVIDKVPTCIPLYLGF